MLRLRIAALSAALLVGLGGCRSTEAADASTPTLMRGVVVSCPGYGGVWGSETMARTLRTLKGVGVSWVQIHPYAGVSRDGSIRWEPAASTGYLDRAAAIARREGVQLFWKPHLAYWGSFSWRGDIAFTSDAQWRRFFSEYRAFIVDQARFAQRHGVPLFSIGLEYRHTLKFERQWRALIADVRKVYRGKITYAANWDRIDEVPFWDAVDIIGVQAYFPLSHEPMPTLEQLRAGWEAPLTRLNALSSKYGKPYLFAEIGYSRSVDAARKPWQPAADASDRAIATRRRAMEAALTRLPQEKNFVGMFWWKWVPRAGYGDRDFALQNPEAQALLARYWGPHRSAEK